MEDSVEEIMNPRHTLRWSVCIQQEETIVEERPSIEQAQKKDAFLL